MMTSSISFPALMTDSFSDHTIELNQGRQNGRGNSVGINIPEMNLSVKAYPNPVTASVNLEMNGPKARAMDILIHNVRGEELNVPLEEKQRDNTCHFVWDFHQYPDGIYFLSFHNKSGQQLKIIKVQKIS
ncbi:MAG: hypothetical protein BRD50_09640 [Bacteroidetes bacterium SW_11_45_7]|nr:MAG: hypothetical protein BRD50_09640 [Bacteroidetes bacterium SW_11_45_7]